jgi:hypothetical protein
MSIGDLSMTEYAGWVENVADDALNSIDPERVAGDRFAGGEVVGSWFENFRRRCSDGQ